MFITLDGLKTALTAVLNIIGNKMDKENPSGVGTLSIDGNAWISGDIKVGGTTPNDTTANTVLTTANFVLEGTTLTITTN
jgi:hypothetical protein